VTDFSIVIPHYRTPAHLDVCLRCLRHHTRAPAEVIVVDNGTEESALAPLLADRGLVLVRREQRPIARQAMEMLAHAEALDAGIERARGAVIVAMHSDAYVIDAGWLDFILGRLERERLEIVGPETHKLYPAGAWERFTARWRRPPHPRMIRPLFAAYRREVFRDRRFALFGDVGWLSVPFLETGRAAIVPREEAARFVFHQGGTTRIANLGHRPTAARRKERRYRAFLARPEVRAALGAGS
jgi:glycosyltransferase involved in cell wall biosynthesis